MATRYEKVVLDIESSLASVMARDAAAAKLLERSLNDLSGTSTRTSRSVSGLDEPISKSAVSSARANKEIDRLSGRLRLLADTAAILGPALIPIGAVGIPAITGLAAQFGAAAFAGGTAILAFQGLGDTLKAVNKAALEPSTANLEAARIAMQKLSPEARSFVRELRDMLPALTGVRNAAAAGLFPGLEASLMDLESMLPRFEDMVYRIGDALGSIAEDSAASLAGPRWRDFIAFIEAEVPQALGQMATIVGSLAHGLSELWMAFDPLNDSFASWMADAARGFDSWAQGLSQSGGFNEFVAYIRENGPRVADALSSIGNALLQIVEAAAPLGGPVLQALSVVADVIADIAGSDAGPAIMGTVTALALLSRGMRTFESVSKTSWATAIKGADTFSGRMLAARGPLLRSSAALAGIALASSGAADGIGLSNTASMALLGTLGGPWGAAVGGAVGLMLDLSHSSEGFKINAEDLTGTLDQQTGAITRNTSAYVANELEKQGVLSKAQDLGLNLTDVTQAALGNSDALDRVTSSLASADAAMFNVNGQAIVSTDTLFDFRDKAAAVEEAVGKTSSELDSATGSLGRVNAATGRAAEGFRQGASAAEQFRAAVERVNRLLEKRANVRDFEAAIDDLTDSLKENGRTLDVGTKKGRANQAALDAIAASAIKVAEGMKGTNRTQFLAQARKDFVDAAQKLGMGEEAARRLADKLGLLGRTKAKPEIDVDTGNAHRAIDGVQSAIDQMHGKTVVINVHTMRTGGGELDYASGGAGRPLAPRSTTSTDPETTPTAGRTTLGFSVADTFASSKSVAKIGSLGNAAGYASSGLGHLADMTRHELVVRERALTKELERAEQKWQAERDLLRDLKDARRDLVQSTAANFMTGLFGDTDLRSAYQGGLLGSGFGQDLLEWAQAQNGGTVVSNPADFLDAYLATLSPDQIAALQGQAQLGQLNQDTSNAQQFQTLLTQLAGLGFDGGAFAELASSGNIGMAQWLASQSADFINMFEQQYDIRNQAAQAVGQVAGNQVWAEAIKDQTKETRGLRNEVRELKRSLHRAEEQREQLEKAIHHEGAHATGEAVGRVINGTAAKAARSV